MPDATTCSLERESWWLRWGFLLAILMVCAIALTPTAADPDLWGHVQYGRDALHAGLPATTTYSYTAEGYRWINHENLAEVTFALLTDSVGPVAMVWLKGLLGLTILGLLILHYSRLRLGMITMCVLILLVAINLTYSWSMRPQIFSFTFFAATLGLLSYCFAGWEGAWHLPWRRRLTRAEGDDSESNTIKNSPQTKSCSLLDASRRMRWLWVAVPLFFLWANSHGGFVAGYCIFSAYLVLRAAEALLSEGRAARGLVMRLGMIVMATGLATLINPYGPGLHRWLLGSLGTPRPEISEWHPLALGNIQTLPFVIFLTLFIASIVVDRKRIDFTHLVLIGIVLWQALSHQRHLPFLALMLGFWAPLPLQSLAHRFGWGREDRQKSGEITPAFKIGLATSLCAVYALLGMRLYERLHDMPVQKDNYPVSAVQFIADHNIEGRIVVTYDWAQYVIAAFGTKEPHQPGLLVAFDGRFRTCYPQEIVDQHFDFFLGDGPEGARSRSETSPPLNDEAKEAVLHYRSPNLVLINRKQWHSVKVIEQQSEEWVLLYQDSLAQVWGLRSWYDDPTCDDYLPPAQRTISELEQTGTVTWPALPVIGRQHNQVARQ